MESLALEVVVTNLAKEFGLFRQNWLYLSYEEGGIYNYRMINANYELYTRTFYPEYTANNYLST